MMARQKEHSGANYKYLFKYQASHDAETKLNLPTIARQRKNLFFCCECNDGHIHVMYHQIFARLGIAQRVIRRW